MDDTWSAQDYVLKLLELLPDEEARIIVRAHRDEVAGLFQQAFADGIDIGTITERLTVPIV